MTRIPSGVATVTLQYLILHFITVYRIATPSATPSGSLTKSIIGKSSSWCPNPNKMKIENLCLQQQAEFLLVNVIPQYYKGILLKFDVAFGLMAKTEKMFSGTCNLYRSIQYSWLFITPLAAVGHDRGSWFSISWLRWATIVAHQSGC